MGKLRTPLLVDAIYTLLVGLVALSPSLVRSVFDYEVKDQGVLILFSAALLALGVIIWAVAGNTERYGGLAPVLVLGLLIFEVLVLWGWGKGFFTARNVLVPFIINAILGIWIWTARPKS